MATDYPSNLANAGQQTKSVYPGTVSPVYGSVTIAANTTLALNDTLSLMTMPGPSSHIVGGWVQLPILDSGDTIRLKLWDGTNNIITGLHANAANNVVIESSAVLALIGSGVSYVGGSALGPIQLKVTTGAGVSVGGSAVVVYFCINVAMD